MQETWVQPLGREDPLQKEMATHSSTLAWRIPRTEEPGRLWSTGLQRVWHDWATSLIVHRTCLGLGVVLYMCSTFWVFSSKIQMSREAQRIETGEKAWGTGLLSAGTAEDDPRKGTGDTGLSAQILHLPSRGKLALPDTVGCSPADQGPPLPWGPLFTTRDEESPSPALKGTCCPATPGNRDIEGPSPRTHLPCWPSWHGRDSHHTLLVRSTSNLRSQHFQTPTPRQRGGEGPSAAPWRPPRGRLLEGLRGFINASLPVAEVSLPNSLSNLGCSPPLSEHQFSLRDRTGPHSLRQRKPAPSKWAKKDRYKGRGKKSRSQRVPAGPTGAPEKLRSGGGGQGPKDKGGARIPGGGGTSNPRS